jgi:hypothetical protein
VIATIPLRADPRGAILVAENARIFIRGQIHGHVTIVCTSSSTVGSSWAAAGISASPHITTKIPGPTNAITGTVKVENGLVYISTSGTTTLVANPDSSLAILASNFILFEKSTAGNDTLPTSTPNYYEDGIHTVGLLHVENGPTDGNRVKCYLTTGGTAADNFILSGVRCKPFEGPGGYNLAYNAGAGGEFATVYDANLMNYPPPGLPERPVLEKLQFQ